jgi:hypothetical protein
LLLHLRLTRKRDKNSNTHAESSLRVTAKDSRLGLNHRAVNHSVNFGLVYTALRCHLLSRSVHSRAALAAFRGIIGRLARRYRRLLSVYLVNGPGHDGELSVVLETTARRNSWLGTLLRGSKPRSLRSCRCIVSEWSF